MSTPLETILKLPAKGISVLLEQLQYIREKSRAGESIRVPLTVFHLRDGTSFRGWLIDQSPKEDAVLLQREPADPRQPVFDLCYFPIREIVAISVLDALPVAKELSFGRIA